MRTVAVVALSFGLCLAVQGADETRRDGNWWRSQTGTAKAIYMIGFFDGMDLGRDFSYWGQPTKSDGSVDGPAAVKVLKAFDDMQRQYMANVTNDQMADGVTKFYEDYRNRSILISRAVWIVLKSISGTPQEQIDQLTENSRKNATKQ